MALAETLLPEGTMRILGAVLLVVLICAGCSLSGEGHNQGELILDSPAAEVTEDPPDPNDWHGRH